MANSSRDLIVLGLTATILFCAYDIFNPERRIKILERDITEKEIDSAYSFNNDTLRYNSINFHKRDTTHYKLDSLDYTNLYEPQIEFNDGTKYTFNSRR